MLRDPVRLVTHFVGIGERGVREDVDEEQRVVPRRHDEGDGARAVPHSHCGVNRGAAERETTTRNAAAAATSHTGVAP